MVVLELIMLTISFSLQQAETRITFVSPPT